MFYFHTRLSKPRAVACPQGFQTSTASGSPTHVLTGAYVHVAILSMITIKKMLQQNMLWFQHHVKNIFATVHVSKYPEYVTTLMTVPEDKMRTLVVRLCRYFPNNYPFLTFYTCLYLYLYLHFVPKRFEQWYIHLFCCTTL